MQADFNWLSASKNLVKITKSKVDHQRSRDLPKNGVETLGPADAAKSPTKTEK